VLYADKAEKNAAIIIFFEKPEDKTPFQRNLWEVWEVHEKTRMRKRKVKNILAFLG
jgi:hypothetical protein